MNTAEMERRLQPIAEKADRQDFIYDLLLACNLPKGTVTRLKNGSLNLSKIPGELHYDKRLFYKEVPTEKLMISDDTLKNDERLLKRKTRLLILTDFETIVVRDLKKNTQRSFPFEKLADGAAILLPLAGAEIYRSANENEADREAAYKLGQLYEELVSKNPDYGNAQNSHGLNVLLSRLLFCFFAEDTGIFPQENLFTDTLANRTSASGKEVTGFLQALFHRLCVEKGPFEPWQNAFPYVNGGLFKTEIPIPEFSAKARAILLECGNLEWSEINPDIFGSMIQAVADPAERSSLGMHYTSVPNILKLIRPLFLDELEAALDKAQGNEKALKKLQLRLSKIKFFDPACGSGNFLIIAYKEIRRIEVEIIRALIALEEAQGKRTIHGSSIRLSQFYGIEIKDFAHEMALLSLWLAEHQMNQYFEEQLAGYGQSEPMLPLKESGRITLGNAARLNWETACPRSKDDEVYIMGNPPYLGARVQDTEQKADVDFVLGHIRGANNLDYIAIWFFKAANYIRCFQVRVAFVSTNSICQGEQVPLLWPQILNDIEIDFAHQSFKWNNNARGNAGVTVIVLGLRNTMAGPKTLFNENLAKEARNINAYLIDAQDIYILPRTSPLSDLPEMDFGNMANDGGNLFLNKNERNIFIQNNNASGIFIKQLIGALEFIRGEEKYCLWIEDAQLIKANKIPDIKARIRLAKLSREASKRPATQRLANVPHRFAEIRHRQTESVFVPSVSSEKREYIPIGFLNSDQIIVAPNFAVYDAEPWLFGVLHSRMHMVWVDAVGGKLETRYRYSAKLCYNTFPFPELTPRQKETINQYVLEVIDAREAHAGRTIAWLYNPDTMPENLRAAHRALDAAIDRLYRLQPFGSDAERLEHLFRKYEEMITAETLFARPRRGRKSAG